MRAIASIHDVMPETMARVEHCMGWLRERGVPPATLLVVPGKPWTEAQILRLRQLSREGHPLAAHGWHHHTVPRRIGHRLHAAIVSRNVAEHLALDPRESLELMRRAHSWFSANDLPAPDLYVPPAWALGRLPGPLLAKTPYRRIETTSGVWHKDAANTLSRHQKMPLVGYEADNAFRARFLRSWNALQRRLAAASRCPLRVAIHPDDPGLRLKNQMNAQIRSVSEWITYGQV